MRRPKWVESWIPPSDSYQTRWRISLDIVEYHQISLDMVDPGLLDL